MLDLGSQLRRYGELLDDLAPELEDRARREQRTATRIHVTDPVASGGRRRSSPIWVLAALIVVIVIAMVALVLRAGSIRDSAPPASRDVPTGADVVARVQVAEPRFGPADLASGGGLVWAGVLSSSENAASATLEPSEPILAVDPATVQSMGAVEVPDHVGAIAYGLDTLFAVTLRFTGSAPWGALQKIDPESRTVVGSVDLATTGRGIAIDDGSVWITDPRYSLVYRVDPASMQVIATIKVPASLIAANTDGIWVSDPYNGSIRRIDPQTNTAEKVFTIEDAMPAQIVATRHRLWVAAGGQGPAELVAFDTRKRARISTTALRGQPTALTVGNGLVWCMVNAIRPEKRLVAGDAHGGPVTEVKLTGDVRAFDLEVVGRDLFAANYNTGELVRMQPVRSR